MWTADKQMKYIKGSVLLCVFDISQNTLSFYSKRLLKILLFYKGGGLESLGELTPALLMTSTGMTVSISSAPLARMTRALFEAISMLYVLKT